MPGDSVDDPGVFLDSDEKHDVTEWLETVHDWYLSIYAGLMAQGYKLGEIDTMDICRHGEIMKFMKQQQIQEEKQKEIDEENEKKAQLMRYLG